MTDERQAQAAMTSTAAYMNDTFFQLRLDTSKLLGELEAFYRGKRIIDWVQKGDDIVPVFSEFGEKRMNDKGLQDVMSWLTSIINPHTVQGNTNDEFFSIFIAELRCDFSDMLMTNIERYDISTDDFMGIVDKTISKVDLFLSRTVDNLERQSYAQTFKSQEVIQDKSGGWSLPNIMRRH